MKKGEERKKKRKHNHTMHWVRRGGRPWLTHFMVLTCLWRIHHSLLPIDGERYELAMVKTSILKTSQKNRSIIRLHYQNERDEDYDGIVVQVTSKIVVIACEKDFEFDGYQVLLRDRIKGYRNSKFEKCCTEILSHNKHLNKIQPPKWINNIEGIDSAIKEIKRHGIWPAIETIFNSESAFYIGPITTISPKLFQLYCYDATGQWEKEYKFGFDDVIRLEWASKYCTHFNKYMKAAVHNPGL